MLSEQQEPADNVNAFVAKKILIIHFLVISLLVCFSAFFSFQQVFAENPDDANQASPDLQRQKELLHLLKQDCGSCHGLRLNGGLGPALKPKNLQDKTVDVLVAIILYGNAEAAMPAWANILKESEARWIALQLKQGVQDES